MSACERHIISDKVHRECPINAQTSTYLPSAIVVDAVLFFVLLLWKFFE